MSDTQKHRDNILEFANRFKLVFEDEGTCGIGRECVGLLSGENYLEYNPINSTSYEYIKEFYNDKFFDIAPEDAYHKHNCVAVLGRGYDAIKQLSDWVDKMNDLGVVVNDYETGATGLQALISGVSAKAIMIN